MPIFSKIKYSDTSLRLGAEYFIENFLSDEAKLERVDSINLKHLASLSVEKVNPTEQPDKPFRYIEIDNIDTVSGEIKPQTIIGHKAPSRARKKVKEKNIIVSMVRPNRNAVALIPSTLNNAVCSTGFAVIIPEKISPEFLFVYLKTRFAINQLVRRTTASMYPAVTEEDIENLIVPIPPTLIEERIIQLVSDAEADFEQADNVYRQAENLFYNSIDLKIDFKNEHVFVTTFSKTSTRLDAEYYQPKFGKIRDKIEEVSKYPSWNLKPVREISEPLKYGTSEKLTYVNNGIPFLRVTDVRNADFDKDSIRYINEKEASKVGYAKVIEGDLLISRSGVYLGLAALIGKDLSNSIFGSYFIRIRPRINVDKEYLAFYLNSIFGKMQVEQISTGAVQPNLTIPAIENMLVLLPKEDFQEKVGKLVKQSKFLREKGKMSLREAETIITNMVEQATIV